MRILIHGVYFSPDLTGIGKYTGELADWLVGHGHEVRVVTAPPFYPEWKVAQGHRSWAYRRESRQGLRVYRTPIWVPRHPRGSTRLIHLASFALASLPVVLAQAFWRPHVILIVAPTLFTAPAAWLSARLSGACAFLHVQDFEVDAALQLDLLRKGGVQRVAEKIERWLLKGFDRVSTIAPSMIDKLREKGVSEERIVLFPNWVDCDRIYPLDRPSKYRLELGISQETLVVMYSGAMGQKQGIELLIDAAKQLAYSKDILFIFAGADAATSRWSRQVGEMTNVRWLPLQPLEQLNEWLNLADIHLLPQRAEAADLVMPSKLTGMLACGRPVIATAADGTQLAKTLKEVGKVVPPSSVDELVNAVLELHGNTALRQVMGANARRYALSHLDRTRLLNGFEDELKSAVRSSIKS